MNCIDIKNLSIEFVTEYQNSLRKSLIFKSEIKTLKALKNINLMISNGEKVAIVGHNGSGKTTLLKTISNIYSPTKGEITVVGKSFSLIDVTMGLDEEITGYENIYLMGAQNLISKKFIDLNLKNICEFSELGESLNRDVRTYSAGMKTRLAASVFINLKPDILICDEFLSAGDEKFQNKFENQMKIILKDIGIFILATHNQKTIKQYCTRVITLSNGEILSDERI